MMLFGHQAFVTCIPLRSSSGLLLPKSTSSLPGTVLRRVFGRYQLKPLNNALRTSFRTQTISCNTSSSSSSDDNSAANTLPNGSTTTTPSPTSTTTDSSFNPISTTRRTVLRLFLAIFSLGFSSIIIPPPNKAIAEASRTSTSTTFMDLSDDDWKARLSPPAYGVLRQSKTEFPFSSALNGEKRTGVYTCAGCDSELYTSKMKFDSGTGWPSFFDVKKNAVTLHRTPSDFFLMRTEVRCAKCDGHLGHVFDDGPKPTGKRFCMNGVAMKFFETTLDE